MFKHTTSVHFISAEGNGNKIMLIPTFVLLYWKKFIFVVGGILSVLLLGRPHNGDVTSHFGTRENPFSGGGAETHSGMDFRGKTGDIVKSTANGKVSFAGVKGGYGNCVIIDHGYNLQTLYGHFSKINVKEGQEIKTGSIVGLVGSTGRSTGPHLHYEVHFKGERINPELYLNFK